MLTEPFLVAQPILEQIEAHQQQAYYVGGCVRDLLLNRPIGDIDITTSATPEQIQKIFLKVIPVGIEHGTVIVRHEHQSYEVTTFRIDGDYADKRHPDAVTFIDNIDKDLERRDFTINALAMNVKGEILDLFDGKRDLKAKVIRTVGNGEERFAEDSLRIIRALRFSSQLGFTIHPDTFTAMLHVKAEIEGLAIERLTNEFAKLFSGDFVNIGIDYLQKLEIQQYLPVFSEHPEILDNLPESLQPLKSFGEVIALFHIMNPEVSVLTWVNAWKCSNKIKLEGIQLVKAYQYFLVNGLDSLLVYQLKEAYYEGFIRLMNSLQPNSIAPQQLMSVKELLPINAGKDIAINGNDIMKLFPTMKGGPWIKQLLTKIEKEIIFGRLQNTEHDIKEWIKWNPPEIN
ncbi:CCA tRNA nucleotidyltransferase [Oceanobacillus arenosus]|uniref:CCA-adding enzyme n=1 Tax=Oceanobacillus arenosus TaxID=1229153 RepID=A0A3D8PVQ1_9BACI|nr:CCA tRNA nucleotidyltransferase [Oceanobacillus arenosus]RDW19627.1 CCA tRNA nucleotidyltransferase [Oceanobacillus arenosus]